MPASHLTTTTTTPWHVADAVLAVLAGADLSSTAARCRLDPADLADAQQTYHAAGLAALEQRQARQCYHLRVQFLDWESAETAAATQLGPRLDQLQHEHAIAGWWFLRKHPYWRLRLHEADTTAVPHTLDELVTTGTLAGWWPGIYEPETAAFGGPAGMTIAHDLFRADTQGVLTYIRHDKPGIGRRELSLLLLNALQHNAGLDWFERGDMYDRVARMRPTPPATDSGRIAKLAATMRPLLATPAHAGGTPLSAQRPAAFTRPWIAAFTDAGNQLREADSGGQLDRGLRAVLAHIVIFHWNRLGLSATTQGILAHAARAAILPGDTNQTVQPGRPSPAPADPSTAAKE